MRILKDFIQGHYRFFKDKYTDKTPQYMKEQILYRLYQCKDDCVPQGHCKHCGCPTEKKVWANSTCNNGERFPDLMHYDLWEKFKKDNNINIEDEKYTGGE